MAKKKNKQQKDPANQEIGQANQEKGQANQGKSQTNQEKGKTKKEELLKALSDFTDKGNWDSFFSLRGSDDAFEWYAEWPQLRSLLAENLMWKTSELSKSLEERLPSKKPPEVRILVPGCGNSRLSEHMYDLGFRDIVNVDFSKVVITNMLRKYLREKPEMKWRVMDITNMQFPNESFDAVVDKGGLDALMEPKIGPRLGNLYLSEVKRVIAVGGKFICLTLAESHVLDLLFHKFRFGWIMSIHTIDQLPPYTNPALQTFVVVVEKDCPTSVSDISTLLDKYSVESHGDQAREFHEALDKERTIRIQYFIDNDVLYKLEDLRLGAKGNISVMVPGRRIKLILGEPGVSKFSYNAILFDAKQDSEQFIYHYAIFLVPQLRSRDWLYTSENGQWLIVSSSKAARLLMVYLDSSNSIFSMDDVQMDLSPLVKQLTPAHYDDTIPIPFLSAGDGISQRESVHQVMSDLTGSIVVEDVVYETMNNDGTNDGHKYRRLIFQRTESLVQSEVLLSEKRSGETVTETEQEASSCGEMEVVHNSLASAYHNGIISGIMLISSHLSVSTSHGNLIKTVVLGLGAGLLPMFMKKTLPSLKIEVVELDPVVLDVARDYFGFEEDDRLKVHIADGIKFVKDIADSKPEEKSSLKVDILVVDVDSSDTSTGLTCPEAGFVEDSFILAAKESLSEQGLFILNLVSRSSSLKDGVYSRMKKVFSNIYRLKLEEDVNEVLFALKTDSPLKEEQLSEARNVLATSSECSQKVLEFSVLIEPLS